MLHGVFPALAIRWSNLLVQPPQLAKGWDEPVPIVGRDEVRHLALDLEHMRHRLLELNQRQRDAERLAILGTFTATIAHEVRIH